MATRDSYAIENPLDICAKGVKLVIREICLVPLVVLTLRVSPKLFGPPRFTSQRATCARYLLLPLVLLVLQAPPFLGGPFRARKGRQVALIPMISKNYLYFPFLVEIAWRHPCYELWGTAAPAVKRRSRPV